MSIIKRRVILIVGIACLIISSVTLSFAAWQATNLGYYQRDIYINTSDLGKTYKKQAENAAAIWNTYLKKYRTINLGTSPYANYIKSAKKEDSFFGQYSVLKTNSATNNRATQFSILINTRTVPSSKSNNFIHSVICHELGHSLGLDDINGSGKDLMDHDRNREKITSPSSDDVTGAKEQAAYLKN